MSACISRSLFSCFWCCCLMVLICPPQAKAEDFGRLFTSAEERRALDNLKSNQQPDGAADVTAPQEVIPTFAPAVSEVRFSGYIKRDDGKYALWLNGQSELSNELSPVETAQFNRAPEATLTAAGKTAHIKPGQIWSLEENTIREGYHADRSASIKEPQPEGP